MYVNESTNEIPTLPDRWILKYRNASSQVGRSTLMDTTETPHAVVVETDEMRKLEELFLII
jgi:hypothetical protein